jgi:hypothetical protein
LDAVVFLGNCSASFVSKDGLIITNHHCAVGALQHNSTPEENLVERGFLAKTRSEERSNGPSARVHVTRRQTDVTSDIRAGLADIADAAERFATLEQRTKEKVRECEALTPDTRCQVSSFFGGARYMLVERLELRDVRLVHAPADAVGNFGGDTDNWRWLRHSADYAFLRAYVGKDGKPADFHKDNVPYQPPHHLAIADEPLREGELVFVAGYPGHTDQLATPLELEEIIEWYFPRQLEYTKQNVAAIARASESDADARIKGVPSTRGLNNWHKFMLGALEGLTKGGALDEKRAEYAAFTKWLANRPNGEGRAVVGELERSIREHQAGRQRRATVSELLHASVLLDAAVNVVRWQKESQKPDAARRPAYQERNRPSMRGHLQALDSRYSKALDVARTSLAIERALTLPEAQRPEALAVLGGGESSAQARRARFERLLGESKFQDAATRLTWFGMSTAKFDALRDPLLDVARRLAPFAEAEEADREAFEGRMLLLRPRYFELLEEFSAQALAPDANATLRITYGTVKGYRTSSEAPEYPAFTRSQEILAKITGVTPFAMPEAVLERLGAGKFGPYADARLEDLPVNFVADLHITGGNSGSPTLDKKGRLVGLAFDGNYEAMASDWLFSPNITRSIHVDIRYVLWLLDAVYGADRLLEEMGIAPSLSN